MNLPSEPRGVVASANRLGDGDGSRRPPSVKAALSVSFTQRAPHRATTREASPIRRNMAMASFDRRKDKEASRDVGAVKGRGYDDSDRSRGRGRGRAGREDSDDDRDYRRKERGRRDDDVDRDRDHRRDRRRDDEGEYKSRDRDYDKGDYRDRERGRDHRDRGRDRDRDHRDRDRGRERDYDHDRRREVSRERSREKRGVREATPPKSSGVDLKKLKEMYGEASGKEKETSSRGRYGTDSADNEVIRLGSRSWK